MLLAIDVGNTNVTLGLYEGEALGPHWRFATDHEKTPDEYGALIQGLFRHSGIDSAEVREVSLGSVVPPVTGALAEACRQYLHCSLLVVDAGSRTGVRVLYDDPAQVGIDRVVNVAAGLRMYGGPACIIDFGTATTFDAVSRSGEFLGGAIAPGIGIASAELFERAAKLPEVELRRPPAAIGRNVTQSLQSGLLFGYVGLVEGIVGRFRAELGEGLKVVATGGLAGVIARETQVISVVAPWLTLDGLRIIYELNRTGMN